MPVGEKDPRVVRTIRVKRGHVHMHMDLVIRFDYGLIVPWVTRQKDGSLVAVSGAHRLLFRASVPIHGKGLRTVSDFVIRAGQSAHFELQYGNSFRNISRRPDLRSSLATTEKFWRNWTSRCKYRGPQREAVTRSLITLKALTYAPTGGIVAAPTTSLPENPGGQRNWDYRYCWLRDATFSLLGFIHAGHHAEARKWKSWLVRCAAGSASQIQVMYGVGGERLLKEWKIPWLEGYRESTPVRVGNAASEQLQLDIYGELVDALYQARGPGKGARGRLRAASSGFGTLREDLAAARPWNLGDTKGKGSIHSFKGHGVGGLRSGNSNGRALPTGSASCRMEGHEAKDSR